MRRLLTVFAALGLSLAAAPAALALDPNRSIKQYKHTRWTASEGAPSGITRITQSPDGYLWLATLDGLVRYDGVRFTVFNKVNSKGLNSTRIIALHEAADGALWIGTEDGGAARYFDGQFETFDGSKGLPANRVGSIFSLADARVGLLTSDGLAYWQNGKIVSADNVSRFERWIYHSCRENAATNGCNPTAWSLELPNLLKREKNGKTDVFTAPVEAEQISETPFYEDSKNALWFSLDNRLWRFADGNFSSFGEENNFRGIVTAILEDREGTLWFGTANDGVFLFKDGNFTNLTTANGLSSNLIRSIFQDRENTIWIGTDNRGLNQVQKQFITALSTNDGLGGVNVYPVLADRGGRVWIGASNSNLNVVENNQIKTFSEVRSATSLFEDRDGTLWIGAQKGLLQYANGRFTKVGADFPVPPPGGALFGTSQDRSGALWFATNKGLFRYENNNFTVYNKNNGFPDDDVRVVYEDSTGKLWVGTYEGLILFENGNFRSFTVADGLASNHIRTIYEDA